MGKISPLLAAEAAKALGVKVYTIGAGVRGEAPMPVKDDFGNTHIVMIPSDVDEDTLGKIAQETGGQFFRATDTEKLERDLRADRPHGENDPHGEEVRARLRAFRLGRGAGTCWSLEPASGWSKPASAACLNTNEFYEIC